MTAEERRLTIAQKIVKSRVYDKLFGPFGVAVWICTVVLSAPHVRNFFIAASAANVSVILYFTIGSAVHLMARNDYRRLRNDR